MSAPGADLAVAGLHEVVRTGLERGGHLLTAGEVRVCEAILNLRSPADRLYARLTGRKPDVFAVDELQVAGIDDVSAGVDALIAAGLADPHVPWERRAEASTVDTLRAACRDLGLPTKGLRAELLARVRTHTGWDRRRWVRVRHRGLVRRLERWTFLRKNPDRAAAVVERMGIVRWPSYELTSGTLHRDRRALLRWEAVLDGLAAWREAEELVGVEAQALAWLGEREEWPRGRLSPERDLVEIAMIAAQDQERQGDAVAARAIYTALVAHGAASASELAFRVGRTFEATGDARAALAALRAGRPGASATDALAIARAERRVARAIGDGFAPDRPLEAPVSRMVRIRSAARAHPAPRDTGGLRSNTAAQRGNSTAQVRPKWIVDGESLLIEAAAVRLLASVGRTALFAEGGLWTTLFALLFRDAYFLPIDGMLPVRRLSGPLDIGTPSFAGRRRAVIDRSRAAIRAGEGPDRVREAYEAHAGEALAGAAWGMADAHHLARTVADLGGAVVDAVLGRLLDEGWGAASGLPDLVVLAGPDARLDGFPSRFGPSAAFVEIKGPTDSVRDAQAVWFDRLIRAGARVERWSVVPAADQPP